MATSLREPGVWYALGAYTSWGLLPVYWKLLRHVPAAQVICHRIVWSCALLAVVVLATGRGREFAAAAATPRSLRTYAVAAVLIAINWSLFIWAVSAGFLVETSLGYYINPLISVVLGVVVLRERLRPLQWLPIFLAGAGVAWLTFIHGSVPWVALALATTFALYGLVKKTAPLGSLDGLTLETAMLVVPAAAYLVFVDLAGYGELFHGEPTIGVMLVGAGAITTAPLLMFASAAQRIPLFWIGLLQYVAPTLQLALGVLVYGEEFHRDQLVGFAMVWAALAIFVFEGLTARPPVVIEAE